MTLAEAPTDLVGHAKPLGQDPAGFPQDPLAGPKLVLCHKQPDDIRADPTGRKAADRSDALSLPPIPHPPIFPPAPLRAMPESSPGSREDLGARPARRGPGRRDDTRGQRYWEALSFRSRGGSDPVPWIHTSDPGDLSARGRGFLRDEAPVGQRHQHAKHEANSSYATTRCLM